MQVASPGPRQPRTRKNFGSSPTKSRVVCTSKAMAFGPLFYQGGPSLSDSSVKELRHKMSAMAEQTRPFQSSTMCHNIHDSFIRKRSRRSTSTTTTTTKPQRIRTSESCYSERLSMWNQYSPRVYIGLALCFPFNGTSHASHLEVEKHIRESLDRLAEARPDFSAKLSVGSEGCASLQRCPEFKIPLHVIPANDQSTDKRIVDYETHRKSGFAPGLFINKTMISSGSLSTEDGIPASKVSLKFVKGGLYLLVELHHSLFDGCSMGIFLNCFAAQTKSKRVVQLGYPTQQVLPGLNRGAGSKQTFEDTVSQCPEYTILRDRSGPTQPKLQRGGVSMSEIARTGKIFVFCNNRLKKLRAVIQHELKLSEEPTLYTILSALAWAHIVQARNGHEDYMPGERLDVESRMRTNGRTGEEENDKESFLWNSVNWRPRVENRDAKGYFGNAVLPVVTRLPLKKVLAACRSTKDLAKFVVPYVQKTITSVDQDYVDKREAMMGAAPDPRLVGVNYDPRMREMVHFNTWRHFGGNTTWSIPGVPTTMSEVVEQIPGSPVESQVSMAEAIRRVHGDWNLGTALILPAPENSEIQELFVSLSEGAMEALCNDKEWLEWVDRIVG